MDDKRREYNKRYYQSHKEQVRKNTLKWTRAHKELMREKSKKYYREHPDICGARLDREVERDYEELLNGDSKEEYDSIYSKSLYLGDEPDIEELIKK